jgi:uncharacterized protein YndB with AHSA1/START domain
MPEKPSNAAPLDAGVITTTRLFEAPRDLVWRAWTDPELIAQWWGPKGFADTIHTFELKPGGRWLHTMHGPDGTDYENESVFREVRVPDRIVFDHLGHPFTATTTLDAVGDRTRVTFAMRFPDAAACERVKSVVVPSNEQNFDRLGALLSRLAQQMASR